MNLNELRDKAYQCAVKHGWHEEEYSNEHFLCLVISELMEAVEADRKGNQTGKEIMRTLMHSTNTITVLTLKKTSSDKSKEL